MTAPPNPTFAETCLGPAVMTGLLEDTLPPEEAAAARQHLERCPACRAELADWQDLEQMCRATEAADALADVHAHGLEHGDVTPGNLLYHPERDAALVADFGLAIRDPARARGTAGFAAPEQWAGRRAPASDVYGLAATLHFLL